MCVKKLRSKSGQFMPLAAMVAVSTVVFTYGVISVYHVSKAKLKVQNLADAVALNLAAQQAQHLNTIVDRNEWLNHLYPNDDGRGTNGRLPGISFVSGHLFTDETSARSYAQLVNSVNEAQRLFSTTYNTFVGAEGSNLTSLHEVLRSDIEDLRTDPTIRVMVWNNDSEAEWANAQLSAMQENPESVGGIQARMIGLQFKAQPISVRYDRERPKTKTFKQLLYGSNPRAPEVGYMALDDGPNAPKISIGSSRRIGVGVMVAKAVNVMGKTIVVSSKSSAFVVDGSGKVPTTTRSGGPLRFSPTFWVKLAGGRG